MSKSNCKLLIIMKILSFKTVLGWITVEEYNNKIKSIKFSRKKNIGKSKKLINLRKQIIKFCLGKKKKIDADFELSGTNLQKKIWNELYKIPYGSTETYGEIAKKVNTSPRYVGNVCGQNKHLLVIPCHRVIRSNGDLGGFSSIGGIKLTKIILYLRSLKKNLFQIMLL